MSEKDDLPAAYYQLRTKDGIISDIRPLNSFLPRMERAAVTHIGSLSAEAGPAITSIPAVEKRTYSMRRYRLVRLYEFQEE